MKKTLIASLFAAGGLFCAVGASAEEVRVGVILPLTGHLASWGGVPPSRGVQVALDEIAATNMLGAGRTIKAFIEDDASDKTQVITLVNKLVTRDKVSVLLGPSTTVLSSVAAPIANQLKTPIITLAVSEAVTKTGPYAFKIYPGPTQVITAVAEHLVDKAKVKSLVVVTARDSEAMVAYTKVMKDYMQTHGVQNVTEETVLSADTDFTALATKLASQKADAIFLNMGPEAAANLAIQARQAGLPPSVKFVGSDGLAAPSYAKIGGGVVKGTIFPTYYFADSPQPLNAKFVAAFKKKYNADPDVYAAIGYSTMMVAATAIKNAGPDADREKIRDALAKLREVSTVLGAGTISYDESRNPSYSLRMMSVTGDRPVSAN